MWRSLVARIVRDDEAAGSNPVIPTILKANRLPLGERFFIFVYFYLISSKMSYRCYLPP